MWRGEFGVSPAALAVEGGNSVRPTTRHVGRQNLITILETERKKIINKNQTKDDFHSFMLVKVYAGVLNYLVGGTGITKLGYETLQLRNKISDLIVGD